MSRGGSMGIFSAIKSFFDPGIDEPWRNEYRQQEAARQAQESISPNTEKKLSTFSSSDDDSSNEIHTSEDTWLPIGFNCVSDFTPSDITNEVGSYQD